MNRNKIKDFIKKNKIAVGVTGTILAVGLLFGVGYGVHSLNKSDDSGTKDMIVEANKNSESSNDEVSTTDIKSEDNKNEQEDTKEVAVNNTDNSSEVNKGEEDKTTSESNTIDGGNKNSGTSTDKKGTTISTSKGESNEGTQNVSKPNNTNTSNNSTGNTSSTHSHSWTPVKKTIHHKEQGHYENVLVKPSWTENVPIYEERELMICNDCGKDLTKLSDRELNAHSRNHIINGEKGSWREEWKTVQVGTKKVHHDAVYKKKWVVDKKAYTETKITGYKCSCGATK